MSAQTLFLIPLGAGAAAAMLLNVGVLLSGVRRPMEIVMWLSFLILIAALASSGLLAVGYSLLSLLL